MDENEFEGKPINILPECEEMVKEALDYIPYKEGIRNIKLGKFRYNIYYRENESNIDILGIWHTSRGTEFGEFSIFS